MTLGGNDAMDYLTTLRKQRNLPDPPCCDADDVELVYTLQQRIAELESMFGGLVGQAVEHKALAMLLVQENQQLRDLARVGIAPDELDKFSQTLGFDAKALLKDGE